MRPIRLSTHALRKAAQRGISVEVTLEIAHAPEQVITLRAGREVRQSRRIDATTGRRYLIRVFVDVGREIDVVVTAYRTTKIEKYGG